MKTKDKILKVSLDLFNQQGERNTSTNHIAAELGISPGNLYYHFRNKQQIVFQLFLQYQEEVERFMGVPEDRAVTFQDKVRYLEGILNSMWDYRFLLRDLPHILQEDEEFRTLHQEFSARTLEAGRLILQRMADAGVLIASREQLDSLMLNIWLVVMSWWSFLQTMEPQNNLQDGASKPYLERAIYQIIAMEEPYICESVRPLLVDLKRRYLGGVSTNPLALFSNMHDPSTGSQGFLQSKRTS